MYKYPRNVSKFIYISSIFHMKIFGLEILGDVEYEKMVVLGRPGAVCLGSIAGAVVWESWCGCGVWGVDWSTAVWMGRWSSEEGV
jgi:hypothetical protein